MDISVEAVGQRVVVRGYEEKRSATVSTPRASASFLPEDVLGGGATIMRTLVVDSTGLYRVHSKFCPW